MSQTSEDKVLFEELFGSDDDMSDISDSDNDSENDPIMPVIPTKKEEYANLIKLVKEIIKDNIDDVLNEKFTMKSLKRALLAKGIKKEYYKEKKQQIIKRLEKLVEQVEKEIVKDQKKLEREKAKKIRAYKKAREDRKKKFFGRNKKSTWKTGLKIS